MKMLCPTHTTCTDPATPIANLSAAAEDSIQFLGLYFGPNGQTPPPLGSHFTAGTCLGICSGDTQQEVITCAQQASLTCAGGGWNPIPNSPYTPPGGDGTGQPPGSGNGGTGSSGSGGDGTPPTPPPNPPVYFPNDAKTGTAICPDGSTFTYTVPAGSVTALSKASANAQAESLAAQFAEQKKVCLLAIPPAACMEKEFNAPVASAGTLTITSGSLPPGLSIAGTSITGTPVDAGVFNFTVQANNNGNIASKAYSIVTFGFDLDAVLPCAIKDFAYDVPVPVLLGPDTVVTLTLDSGSLPPGITLDDFGHILGIPTAAGDYPFTLALTDDDGNKCTKAFSIHVDQCIITSSMPDGEVCHAYTTQTGDPVKLILGCPIPPPGKKYQMLVETGALPSGLTLDPDTGIIEGTPSIQGAFNFTIGLFIIDDI